MKTADRAAPSFSPETIRIILTLCHSEFEIGFNSVVISLQLIKNAHYFS